MSTEQNKSIVYRWVEEAWNNSNFSSARELYPPTYRLNDDTVPSPVIGPDGLSSFISVFRAAMPNLRMTVLQAVGEGEMVAWRFRVEGTQTGELFGVPGANQRISITGTVTSRFENGKWMEDYVNWDLYSMLVQMGAIPQPAAGK